PLRCRWWRSGDSTAGRVRRRGDDRVHRQLKPGRPERSRHLDELGFGRTHRWRPVRRHRFWYGRRRRFRRHSTLRAAGRSGPAGRFGLRPSDPVPTDRWLRGGRRRIRRRRGWRRRGDRDGGDPGMTYEAEAASRRIYRGLNRQERAGWIAGLTVVQASACLALATPVLLEISNGRWRAALGWAAMDGV